MSVLTLIVDKIMPIGLALIVYKLVSVLTLIADEIVTGFNIDSKGKQSCTWIDKGLRNPCGVGHLLQV